MKCKTCGQRIVERKPQKQIPGPIRGRDTKGLEMKNWRRPAGPRRHLSPRRTK